MDKQGIIKHKKVFDQWLKGGVVQLKSYGGQWVTLRGSINFHLQHDYRIKPAAKIVNRFANIYRDGEYGVLHESLLMASIKRANNCVACVEITVEYEEGEGL